MSVSLCMTSTMSLPSMLPACSRLQVITFGLIAGAICVLFLGGDLILPALGFLDVLGGGVIPFVACDGSTPYLGSALSCCSLQGSYLHVLVALYRVPYIMSEMLISMPFTWRVVKTYLLTLAAWFLSLLLSMYARALLGEKILRGLWSTPI